MPNSEEDQQLAQALQSLASADAAPEAAPAKPAVDEAEDAKKPKSDDVTRFLDKSESFTDHTDDKNEKAKKKEMDNEPGLEDLILTANFNSEKMPVLNLIKKGIQKYKDSKNKDDPDHEQSAETENSDSEQSAETNSDTSASSPAQQLSIEAPSATAESDPDSSADTDSNLSSVEDSLTDLASSADPSITPSA